MDIGEVSRRSGIATSALRYYEELGLIASAHRKGLRRQYSSNVLDILALITLAKFADFRLEELSQLFKSDGKAISINRKRLSNKSLEIEDKIKRLSAARRGLIHASQCRAANHLECPKFRRLLKIVTKKQIKKRRV
jgi:DNA-binding transcriptional MerR regulator